MTQKTGPLPSGSALPLAYRSLGQVIRQEGRLPYRNAAWVGAQISSALAVLHAAGDVHGGVSPDSILDHEGRAVLTPGPGADTANGPEDDLRDLGASLYHAVEGRPVAGEAAPMSHAGPLRPLLVELLSPDPARRPTAARAADRFMELLRPTPFLSRRRLLGLGAAAVLTAALPPAAYFLLREDPPPAPVPAGPPTLTRVNGASAPKDLVTLAFSPDSRLLAVDANLSGEGGVRLWNTDVLSPSGRLIAHPREVSDMAFSPDGRVLAVGGEDGSVRLWDVAARTPIGGALRHDGEVYCMAFSPDGRLLAVGYDDSTARLWDVERRVPVKGPFHHGLPVSSIDFSPDGRLLATGGCADENLGWAHLWDVKTHVQSGGALQHEHWINSVKFSPDGRTLATSCYDGKAHLWDIANRVRSTVFSHPDAVHTLSYNPDGSILATGCRNGELRLWDTARGVLLDRPLQQGATIYFTAFSPDGRTVAVTTEKGELHLWRVSR